MQLVINLHPSDQEWTRTLQVTLHIVSDPALDIHTKPETTEPTATDLAALIQALVQYLSPSLAEGKLPVSSGLRVFGRSSHITASFRREPHDLPPAGITAPLASVPPMPSA